MFFKKAVNCELAVTVPNLLAMCELAIFYIVYKRSVISLAGQSLTLAIKLYTDSVKRLSQQGIVYQNLKNSLIIHEENTKKNDKRVVSVYVIQIHVDLHKL
jgi:hypothetical protein